MGVSWIAMPGRRAFLDIIDDPSRPRGLLPHQMTALAAEIRYALVESVCTSRGHLRPVSGTTSDIDLVGLGAILCTDKSDIPVRSIALRPTKYIHGGTAVWLTQARGGLRYTRPLDERVPG